MNNKVKQSKLKILLAISIIMAIGSYFLYFHHLFKQDRDFGFVDTENITMDYTIYPSTIPENQLLRIKEAEKLYHQAFDDQIFYTVRDPDKLVKFIKHAWQWDKNAMPYYYDLLHWHDFYDENKEEGMMSFTEFMKKYRHQLVDNTGKPLVEPVVFKKPDMNIYLRNKFADLKYPKFAYEKGWEFSPCTGNNNEEYLPCTDEQLKESIKYFTYALEDGYHCYEHLTARMLFQEGYHYKDNDFKKINKLTEYRKSLTPEDLKQAIDYTEIMAEHSSIIGILRVTEAYLYGLGREQDLVKAYAWTL
ncbi:sel1 repeat family protein, partial [Gilliamella sp. A7]|uniref:sel1 repeat family protein n=1 Tax=Gilliamella sp. A7 TaxID=1970465 RepID=UPI000B6D120B